MNKKLKNYAYIDSQNLNRGVIALGWKLDYKKFRIYLKEKYGVETAYLFIGFIPEQQELYSSLQKDGYILKFKPVLPNKDGSHKGNVDADMVLQIAIDFYEKHFDRAIIVSSDGDFYSAVKFLYEKQKLQTVISPHFKTCSILLKRTAKERIVFIDNLRKKLEYKKKNTA
ncbi:MAG: NYN domain-containing protein [Candidatus Doudnabacteria bacterium]|nr:NYN domain-containing protein [Candidatus Doudnabacteria bacterium]